jgi:hypothetical protein
MSRYSLLILTVCALPAFAEGPINAERPGFSSSPLTLGEGLWQIESGYQYTRVRPEQDSHSLPLLLLRYGTGARTEVQFNWPGLSWNDLGATSVNGATDASIGIKWQLTDSDAGTPVGLFAGLSLPIGDNDLSSDEIDPVMGLFWSHDGRVSLFGTALVSDFGEATTIGNAIGIGLPMRGGRSAYVEYFGQWPEGQGPQHTLNGGVIFLRSYDLQFDVHAGAGLNDRAADGFLGLGMAWRF